MPAPDSMGGSPRMTASASATLPWSSNTPPSVVCSDCAYDAAPADVQRFAAQWGGHATCCTPGATREPFQPLPPALLRVHRQLKAQLDPHAIFNPGRLYADF